MTIKEICSAFAAGMKPLEAALADARGMISDTRERHGRTIDAARASFAALAAGIKDAGDRAREQLS